MPPLVKYFIRRILYIPVTLFIVTSILYGFLMLTPPEERATLYLPRRVDRMTPEAIKRVTEQIIIDHHLRDSFPLQYYYWSSNMLKGEWGWSPLLQDYVLRAINRRSPVTIELTLYSMLVFIPGGVISGVLASKKKNGLGDRAFTSSAFFGLSIPTFIIGIMLMGIFYVMLHWFPPGRNDTAFSAAIASPDFRHFTSLLTVDALLNGRPDITLDALKRLVLPVLSLSIAQWATLGRIARVISLDEQQKEYIIAARARGIGAKKIYWKHILKNVWGPILSYSGLSTAYLFTGVIVIEKTFNFKGISELVTSFTSIPDTLAVMGFAVYCVLIVLAIMFIFDIVQAVIDPRVRHGLLND